MKAFSLSLLAVFCFTAVSFAQYQQTQKVSGKAVIKTPTILCEKCQEKVEFFISHRPGFKKLPKECKAEITAAKAKAAALNPVVTPAVKQ